MLPLDREPLSRDRQARPRPRSRRIGQWPFSIQHLPAGRQVRHLALGCPQPAVAGKRTDV